jgi:hypothetical protein
MTYEQQWLEYDYNPFILFSSSGKILSVNAEAQFLLGVASTTELFELATSYASVSFGFKTTFVKLEFGRYKFFGITVGYENEEKIGIKLYQKPSFNLKKPTSPQKGEITNIYTLLDLCIATNSISSSTQFIKEFDPTIPEIILDSNSFIKLINKAYLSFSTSSKIVTKVYFRIGEYIKFEDKKYTLFSIKISTDETSKHYTLKQFEEFIQESEYFVDIGKSSITINIPIITS